MKNSNLDMKTRPSCKSFHYISVSKNINFIINNNDENKDDSGVANVVATDHRVSNFLFSLYISFLSSSFTILFPTYLYKKVFSRKILPEKSLLYYNTKSYCFYLYVKFKVHISRRFFNVRLFS